MQKGLYKPLSSGFTLVEVLIALGLLSFIFLAVYRLQNVVLDQQEYTLSSYLTVDVANRSIEEMVREIRNSRDGDNGAYILETTLDHHLSFFTDSDSDCRVDRVRYFLEDTNLKKGVTPPSNYPIEYLPQNEKITTIAEDVQNGSLPIFTYYNGQWPADHTNNPLTQGYRQTQTRLIGVTLLINSNPNLIEATHTLSSYAQLRTLKDNL